MKAILTVWNARGSGVDRIARFSPFSGYGNTWDIMINKYMSAYWNTQVANGSQALLGMLAEAGTPRGKRGGGIFTSESLEVDTINSTNQFRTEYGWYGWSKKKNKINLRCSMAILQNLPEDKPDDYPEIEKYLPLPATRVGGQFVNTRPFFQARFDYIDFKLSVFLVHLPSGKKNLQLNISLLKSLMNTAETYGIPAIIAGDMNINIRNISYNSLVNDLDLNHNWQILRTGYSTQQSGGELDWALAYKCNNCQAKMIGPLTVSKTGKGLGIIPKGISDHAIIAYSIKD